MAADGKKGDACNGSATQFRFTDIVDKKIKQNDWTKDEIEWFVSGVVSKRIQESQIGAWLMAVFIRGMNDAETASLTEAMMKSGDLLKWPEEWEGQLVDKHSTGGVGDKVSLILAPALAACGKKVPMISARGLAHTGGTLDKLESIPGYTVELSAQQMVDTLAEVGCCICGQTGNLVPADKLLYAIRDVTGTVASLPLITSSIISKKGAENVNKLVLDVKVGKAAFFSSTVEKGRNMANSLVSASCRLGTKTTAVLTRMDNPIGYCIGSSLEVAESLQCLHGKGPSDLRTLVVELGGRLLDSRQGGNAGRQQIEAVLDNKAALKKFKDMIVSQNVEESLATHLCNLSMDDPDDVWEVLTKAPKTTDLKAEKDGYISSINSLDIAHVCVGLGAGRTVAGQAINHSVGAKLLAHVGSLVKRGDPWITIYHQPSDLTDEYIAKLQASVEFSSESVHAEDIIIDVIESP